MKPNIKVTAQSLKKTLNDLQKFGKETERFISEITQGAANEIRDKATNNARTLGIQDAVTPVGQPIIVEQAGTGGMLYNIAVQNVPLAAYYEFGTGAFVEVAPEWKNLAWEFYVNGQGTLSAKPYLYPAFRSVRAQYQKDLQQEIDRLSKKYSG